MPKPARLVAFKLFGMIHSKKYSLHHGPTCTCNICKYMKETKVSCPVLPCKTHTDSFYFFYSAVSVSFFKCWLG